MKKHKMPIGNLLGGFNRNQIYTLTIMIVFLMILFKRYMIISFLIVLVLLVYIVIMYYKSHKITLQEKELNIDIKWHTLTKNELLFLRAYYQAKLQIYIKSFISTFIFLIIASIVLYISQNKAFRYILIISIIYFIISLIVIVYLLICKKIDVSAECTYIPIQKKYSVDLSFKGHKKINNYAIVIMNYKKYIYKISNVECNEIMIVNYKGLSCAINSKVLPY